MTDADVALKLAVLHENLQRLADLPQESYEAFTADFRTLDSALHRLQTSIQVLIDIAAYIAARRGLGSQGSSAETLEKLEEAGHLPAGSAEKYSPLIGFRNRVVHLYDQVDAQVVFEIVTRERSDLETLARLLLRRE